MDELRRAMTEAAYRMLREEVIRRAKRNSLNGRSEHLTANGERWRESFRFEGGELAEYKWAEVGSQGDC